MIGVDFRNRGPAEQVQEAITGLFVRARTFRSGLIVIGILFAFVFFEAIRLTSALSNMQELERQRDVLRIKVQNIQIQVKAISDRRAALLAALERRRSNVDLATTIAAASDLVATSMALTQLRVAPGGFEVEGRGTNLTDIRASLARLESMFDGSATFELNRDEMGSSAVSFRFDIVRK